MGMSKQERAIREKRTLEATKKNYMGAAGKLGMIAKFLGQPIIREGGGILEMSFMTDLYYFEDENELPTTQNLEIQEVGQEFNGLSSGMHLEIKYLYAEQKLHVEYKGYTVYKEIAGDLFGFAPFPEWENLIEKLYVKAKERKKKMELEMEPFIEDIVQRKKQNWLQKMRHRWGI